MQTARTLAIETGSVPSMDDVAQHAGVSKGGLMHHFRSRAALVEGVALQAIDEMDQALVAAAERGDAVETWLRLSASREEAALYRAMVILLTDPHLTDNLMRRAAEAAEQWERLFAGETGDPVAAAVIRLVGDGMLLNGISGGTPLGHRLDRAVVDQEGDRMISSGLLASIAALALADSLNPATIVVITLVLLTVHHRLSASALTFVLGALCTVFLLGAVIFLGAGAGAGAVSEGLQWLRRAVFLVAAVSLTVAGARRLKTRARKVIALPPWFGAWTAAPLGVVVTGADLPTPSPTSSPSNAWSTPTFPSPLDSSSLEATRWSTAPHV